MEQETGKMNLLLADVDSAMSSAAEINHGKIPFCVVTSSSTICSDKNARTAVLSVGNIVSHRHSPGRFDHRSRLIHLQWAAGCREARYCVRTCQERDWKHHGHRKWRRSIQCSLTGELITGPASS